LGESGSALIRTSCRDHVSRELAGNEIANHDLVDLRCELREGDEALLSVFVGMRNDGDRRDGGVRSDRGLDLGKLDAVTGELDLIDRHVRIRVAVRVRGLRKPCRAP